MQRKSTSATREQCTRGKRPRLNACCLDLCEVLSARTYSASRLPHLSLHHSQPRPMSALFLELPTIHMYVHSACVKPRLESPELPDTQEIHPTNPPPRSPSRGVVQDRYRSLDGVSCVRHPHESPRYHARLLSIKAMRDFFKQAHGKGNAHGRPCET